MGDILSAMLDDWSEGVNTALSTDRLPINACPRGHNSMFAGIGTGKVAIKRRHGCTIGNATAIAGTTAPAILGQYAYKKVASGAITQQHLIVSDAGRLDILASGTAAAADATAASPFTTGTKYPSFATANNLCFFANGTDLKKFNGTNVQNFGITRPVVGTLSGAAGAAGSPSGTYELRVAYYNSATGHFSSASNTATATVVVVGQQISVSNIPVSSDAQVTHNYIGIRNTSTMTVFYQAGSVAAATTTATLNFSDASLITPFPDTVENEPPVSSIRYLAWYKSRLFAASDTLLYYSKLEFPEAFPADNYEPISPNDGQRITGILPAFECLLIFKTRSIYGLFGEPGSWEIRNIVPDIGCETFRSICVADGKVYWLSIQGLMRMATLGVAEPIGQTYLSGTFNAAILNLSKYTNACAVADLVNTQILLALPDYGETRNTRIIPFNYRIGRFEADVWDPMDVSAWGLIDDTTTGQPWVYLGGYGGQVFLWGTGTLDGIATGCTTSGTLTSTASSTQFSDSTAAFTTAGAGLAERTAVFISTTGVTVRRRIVSNTATQLTITPATTAVTTGWTYVVGSPDFQWDTPWLLVDPRFWKKRFKHAYGMINADSTLSMDLSTNFAEAIVATLEFTAANSAPVWGTMVWGTSLWGSMTPYGTTRQRIGRTGTALRLRIRIRIPNKPITVYALGVTGEQKSDKLG